MTMLNGKPINTPNISTAPVTSPAAATSETPLDGSGRMMGLMALIFSFSIPIGGAILGFIAMRRAQQQGSSNPMATAGFWIGLALTVIVIVATVLVIVFSVGIFGQVLEICQELGQGTHTENGVTYECN